MFTPALTAEESGGSYDLRLTVRHTDSYGADRLRLVIGEERDSVALPSDTIEVVLADSGGRWLGSGSHGVYSRSVVLRRGFRPGDGCRITVRPDAGAPVAGISRIGLSFVKSE